MDNQAKTANSDREPFIRDFKALPLDEKFSRLFSMEAVALGEAVTFVVNETMKAIEKGGDLINDLGSRMKAEAAKNETPPAADSSTPKDKQGRAKKSQ